jgi:hypothetical protein
MVIISYTLDLRDLVAEFPEAKKNPKQVKYIAEKVLADKR